MARRYCYNDVLPLIAMVTAVCTNVGVNILFKEATSKGMNQYIFITYSYVVAALVLLPLSFIFPRRATVPSLKYFYLGSRLFLIGLIGFLAQICAYKGIAYSSPTLASAMSNLGPAFTFILAVLFRLEKVALRSSSSQAKIMGTITSVSGALLVVLYKGPKVILQSPLESSEANWIIGGILLFFAYLLFAIQMIVQGAIQSFMTLVMTWGLHLKGPVYIAIFSPLSIAIAAFMSAIFLGDSLHLGSIIGATIISMGFYAVIWGQSKEDERVSSNGKAPLLEMEDCEEQLK
ncbi:WAT1-related protein [Gossypium australe]|uniref:WAT1-related protein n=1 Tax=Gossypium australe TaxID=47621 RepID=A0A5B6UKD8_9ROSI|nr:WAT1-related protein [Gossypium australe]